MSNKFTNIENFDLVMNFICPKCKGNTSQATFYSDEIIKIHNIRVCEDCGELYSILTTFDNIEKYNIFKNELLKAINNKKGKKYIVKNDTAKFVIKEFSKLIKERGKNDRK